jgi:hypothetical protein
LLGRRDRDGPPVPLGNSLAVGLLGLLVLALAVGMPVWLAALSPAASTGFAGAAIAKMHVGPLLVPATGAPIRLQGTFAFISPTLLVVAMPLLALVPLGLLFASRRFTVRRAPVWYGGREQEPEKAATTALTFSNALRTFYSFIYRPTAATERELALGANGRPYFVRRLAFSHDVAPLFGPHLFAPLERFVVSLAGRLRLVQSGHLAFYLALIGALLVAVLVVTLS